MAKKSKIKTAGRFGARYGRGVKLRVIKIEEKEKKKHKCPACGFSRLKRKAAGLYKCTKCGLEIAGGAYTPTTMSGEIISKMVSQKTFFPLVKELTKAKEEHEIELEEEQSEGAEKQKKLSGKEQKETEKESGEIESKDAVEVKEFEERKEGNNV